jgi:diguanylate cyclase (GGDEF)-like protein/PAS domain S-box-containing protein
VQSTSLAAQVRRLHRRLSLVTSNSSDIVVGVRVDGTVEWASRPIVLWDTVEPNSLVGVAPWDVIHPDDLAPSLAALAEIVAGGRLESPHVLRLRKGAEYRWVSVNGHRIDDPEDEAIVVLSFRVCDDEIRAAAALAESEQRYRLLAENATDVVYSVDTAGVCNWVSPSLTEVLGWSPEEFANHHVVEFMHPDDLAENLPKLQQVMGSGGARGRAEMRYRTVDGAWRWMSLTGRTMRDAHGVLMGGIESLRDIQSEVEARAALETSERQFEFAATHDSLTGLANRANLVDEIQRAISSSNRSGRPTAVVMLDLDHFKYVNDSLGHPVGDQLLRRAADRLRATVREGDLVARHGGDEFVVVMRDLDDPAESVRIAQRIVEAFRSPVLIGTAELYATASIGVAVTRRGADADTLLAEADTALYVAKADGRDRYSLFNDELRAAVTERLRIEGGLRHALERDELDVWYQPEVDLEDGRVTAVEALLRWHHPSGALYSAERFIEIAEESGLIVDLGAMVIGRACAQTVMWNRDRSDRPVVVRVNLSTRQLAEAGLLGTIDRALVATGASPSWLCFEITESAILRALPVVDDNLRGIRRRGIELALADFGTGYASLTYLREIPVAVLKLDRSFIRHLADSEFDRRLVAGVVGLAHGLHVEVTAEGVEEETQAEILRELGCRRAQGFLFSGAVPAAVIDTMLASRPRQV